ncbi:UDP-N-acetylmuramate--L-alanine ligase, partial [Armatimonas sp.]|uniref:UDP-N-acetylmuramate--L-alanine ligase n=1 Tax=Armatimonas sp. TaxID=1872638 RepID=UPI00286CBF20
RTKPGGFEPGGFRVGSPAEVRPLPDGPLHFVGIGGAGQSAIAYVLAQRGRVVRGSDSGISDAARARLESVGCQIFTTHAAENLAPDTAAVIATDAVNEQNPEVAEALKRGLPVFRRPEALANLTNSAKTSICVAGTHGKTTTTGMIASILIHAGLTPTVLIGGDLPLINGNSQNGDPDLVVAEACEAYGGLDCLSPTIAVITNCEPDHLDFHGSEENFYAAFTRFINNTRSDGTVFYHSEDKGSRIAVHNASPFNVRLRSFQGNSTTLKSGKITVTNDGLIKFPIFSSKSEIFLFDDRSRSIQIGEVTLRTPGSHNIDNACVAILAVLFTCLGVTTEQAIAGLETFTGTGRRFERLGEVGDIAVVDDYAHHPTEIRATLQAARQAFPNRRIVAIYQPHLPSRTRDFLDGFADALIGADVLYLTDIYLAREPEQPGLIETLAEKSGATLVKDRFALPSTLARELKPGDVALFMGAGNIREQAEEFLRGL